MLRWRPVVHELSHLRRRSPQNDLVRGGGGSGDNEEHGVGSDHATYTVTLPNQKVGLSLRGERPARFRSGSGGDADRAGVTRGSELLRINGSDVTTTSHSLHRRYCQCNETCAVGTEAGKHSVSPCLHLLVGPRHHLEPLCCAARRA